ncbi:SNF-related serine/threonine-protein kinase [Nymphon striatum]|nr:SNF-related serine/threonine-protein kinase [Nymphon striatum]
MMKLWLMFKEDVWSLGVILFMLVCGQAPFQEVNDSETLTMIMDCKYTIPCYVSLGCRRLIENMLIREPEKRSTMEYIANNEWLRETDDLQPAEYLPLVSREHLQEEDHAYIVQKMVNGNIASKEEILEALDKNLYDHVTATYFLLAERKLRAQRHLKAQSIHNIQAESKAGNSSSSPPSKKTNMPKLDQLNSLSPPISPLVIKLQAHKDEESISQASSRRESLRSCVSTPDISSPTKKPSTEIDSENKSSSASSSCASSPVSPKVTFKPIQPSTSASVPKQSVQFQPLPTNTSNSKYNKSNSANSNRRLQSVKSSPQLILNEICEEGESDIEGTHTDKTDSTSPPRSNQNVMTADMMQRFETRLTTGRSKAKARTASCSSSEASDDDADNRKRSKHTRATHHVKSLPPRRDHSHDDSSDSQDQGFNGPGNSNRGRKTVRANVTYNGDGSSQGGGNSSKGGENQNQNHKSNNGGYKKSTDHLSLHPTESKKLSHSSSVAGVVLSSISHTVSSFHGPVISNGDEAFDSTDSIPIPEFRRLSYQDDENILPQLYIRNSKETKDKKNNKSTNINNLSGSISVDSNLCGSNIYGFNLLREGLKFARKTTSSNGLNKSNGKIYKVSSISTSCIPAVDQKSYKFKPGQLTTVNNNSKLDINQNGLKKHLGNKKPKGSKHSIIVDPSSKCCRLS